LAPPGLGPTVQTLPVLCRAAGHPEKGNPQRCGCDVLADRIESEMRPL